MAITIGVTVFTSCNEEDSTDTLKEEQDATFEKKRKQRQMKGLQIKKEIHGI